VAGIQLTGLVSGLDTASIIDQLMTVERTPRTAISNQQTVATKRQSLLQDIGTKLTALKTASDDLKSIATWGDTQTVASSYEKKLTVTRTAGAPPGGYDVQIASLASAERRTYDYQAPTADGPLQIFEADGTTPRASIDLKAGATVDDAVAAINSSTTAKLYAVNVNGDLVLSARTTGASSGFVAAGAGTETEKVPGADADIFINGKEYKRPTNVITDALPGVTLTLKAKTTASDSLGLTVGAPGPDLTKVTGKVKAFVDAYNAVVTTTRADLAEKPVSGATSTSDLQKGTLFGDTGLSNMLSTLRLAVGSSVAGLVAPGAPSSLADLGISTGAATTGATVNADAVSGKLVLDADKLSAALAANPLGVRTLLGATSGTPGFTQQFQTALAGFQGVDGAIAMRVTSTGQDLKRISDKLTAFDARMDTRQAFYQKQFTALELALQQSQSVGARLSSYISSSG